MSLFGLESDLMYVEIFLHFAVGPLCHGTSCFQDQLELLPKHEHIWGKPNIEVEKNMMNMMNVKNVLDYLLGLERIAMQCFFYRGASNGIIRTVEGAFHHQVGKTATQLTRLWPPSVSHCVSLTLILALLTGSRLTPACTKEKGL